MSGAVVQAGGSVGDWKENQESNCFYPSLLRPRAYPTLVGGESRHLHSYGPVV